MNNVEISRSDLEWLAYLAAQRPGFESLESDYNRRSMENLLITCVVMKRYQSSVFGTLTWYSLTRRGIELAIEYGLKVHSGHKHLEPA